MENSTAVSNPWVETTSSSFSSTVSIDSTLINLSEVNSLRINDPLREFVQEKVEEGNEQRLLQIERLFGEAWTEVPEKLVTDLALALETDQLDPSVVQFHHSSGSGSLSHKVLVHWVSPEDTLPGIALKYDIRIEHLKRFNRLWPSDNKAHRPYLFIPLALTPKLNNYSREYPDLFYEVHLRSLDALPITSGPSYESAIPPILQNLGARSSTTNSSSASLGDPHLAEGLKKEPKQRPILVIPNGQLKYFPSKKPSPTSRNRISKTHNSKTSNSGVLSGYMDSLAPLFSSSPTRHSNNSNQSLPDELETEILTHNLIPPFSSTPRRFSPMSQSYNLQGSQLRKTVSETANFDQHDVELEMQPLCFKNQLS